MSDAIDELREFERLCQLYRERQENDEALADLSAELKAKGYREIPELKAEAREAVAPDKQAKREAKDMKRQALRERLGRA
jgi:hypothetical protein